MYMKISLLCMLYCVAFCIADDDSWTHMLEGVWRRFKKDVGCFTDAGKRTKPHVPCEENRLMLQLARLYIVAPESMVLMLTTQSEQNTCDEVKDVLHHINITLANCDAPPPDNLYTRLIAGLSYYYEFICGPHDNQKIKHITYYHDCLKELREDIFDCGGPADWFEKTNETLVCPYYNDIINCNYVKTALLCGLTPAVLIRTFTIEVFKRVVTVSVQPSVAVLIDLASSIAIALMPLQFRCKVSRSLPYVENPMLAAAHRPATTSSLYRICLLSLSVFINLHVVSATNAIAPA